MKSLNHTLNLNKEELDGIIFDMYWNKNLSQQSIAKELGCHVTTIENIFRKGRVKARSAQEACRNTKLRNCLINEKELSILNGLLLSDFHIEDGAFQARLAFGFKHKEFAEFCIKSLPCFEWLDVKQCKTTGCWHSKTKFYKELFDLRQQWYIDRKKIVPSINVSKETALFWFLGDGMKIKNGSGGLLCCESFDISYNQALSDQLTILGIKNHVTPSNRIRLSGAKGLESFLQYIGTSPVECYRYKFEL